MSRTCSVCSHPDRREIDRELVGRTSSYRNISERFSLSLGAISRHTKEHLPALLVRAHAATEVADADRLLARVQGMTERLEAWIDRAERSFDYKEVRAFAAEWRQQVELLAKLAGQLREHHAVHFHLHPEWIEIKMLLIDTLGDYPTARAAVVRALTGHEEQKGLEASDNGHP